MLVLAVIQGPDKGRKFELPGHEPQLIGRSSEAMPINDTTISRVHAELTPDGNVWYIRDLQSQNGTYVNGARITERTRLRAGDQVRVGSTLMVFGMTDSQDPDVVRVRPPSEMDAAIERTLSSNDDSIILSEPEPRAAAVEHLRVIYQLTGLLTSDISRGELLTRVLGLVFEEFKPERGVVMLTGDAPGAPLVSAAVKYRTAPGNTDDATINVSKTILRHCIDRSEGVLCTNAMNDPRFAKGDSVQRMHIRSAVCSPIRTRDRVHGAIYIDSSIANYTFTPEQLALLNAIGQHTGLALANAELYAQKLQGERLAATGVAVASLSHSIKNILQGLRGGADVLELGLNKDDLKIARGGWSILHRNLDRIMALTLNMLTYSRQRRPEFELVRLATLIEECELLLRDACETKQVALIIDVDPEMPPVPLDPHLMHQALVNLMTNAVEAVESGTGAVTVRAAYHASGIASLPSGPAIEIAVIDNGPGVPADKQKWIFEPFNTTKGLRGTGLGLAVTKRIIEEHRGRIDVVSSNGATFRLLVPVDTVVFDPSATAG